MNPLVFLLAWATFSDGSVIASTPKNPEPTVEQCHADGDDFITNARAASATVGVTEAHYVCLALTPKESTDGVDGNQQDGQVP